MFPNAIFTGTFEGGEAGCLSLPNRESEFKQNLALTVKFAKALNCRKYDCKPTTMLTNLIKFNFRIHLMAGKVIGPVTQLHHDTYEKNLRYAADVLAPEGIVGVIEPICVYGVPDYYLNNYARG